MNWLYSVDGPSRGKQSKDRDIWFTKMKMIIMSISMSMHSI
jgi:hypothetical protein